MSETKIIYADQGIITTFGDAKAPKCRIAFAGLSFSCIFDDDEDGFPTTYLDEKRALDVIALTVDDHARDNYVSTIRLLSLRNEPLIVSASLPRRSIELQTTGIGKSDWKNPSPKLREFKRTPTKSVYLHWPKHNLRYDDRYREYGILLKEGFLAYTEEDAAFASIMSGL